MKLMRISDLCSIGTNGFVRPLAAIAALSAFAAPAAHAADFATRCADANVVRCYGFEDQADLPNRIFGRSSDNQRLMTYDTAQKASGNASLRAEIPTRSPADTSGSFFINFADDFSQRFGEGTEFYVQWRQRFSPDFLRNFRGGNGWKQIIVGAGDYPGTINYSCSEQETVFQQDTRSGGGGHPWVYHSCGRFDDLEYSDGTQIRMQHQGPPFCYYPNDPQGGCKKYVANQWMTFQMHIQINRWNQSNSRFRGWMAEEGGTSVMIYDSNLSGGMTYYRNNDPSAFFGKVWFLPYNTGKDATEDHAVAYTWYDDLIISRARIADPDGTAPDPEATVTLSANPTSIPSGGSSQLTWSSTEATACTASGGWTGSKAISGSETVGPLTQSRTYTLTCSNATSSANRSATVTVASSTPQPTVNISADPTSVATGGTSTLSWSTSDAMSCTASGGWSGARATQGSESVGPISVQTIYTLACTGAGGSRTRSVTVSLLGAPVVTLSANPTSVSPGSATTLTWSSTNATSCTASGSWAGSKATSGSEQSPALNNNGTFGLECSGAGGSGNASVNVTVTPGGGTNPPPPAPPPSEGSSGGGSTDPFLLMALLGLLLTTFRTAARRN